MKSLLSGRHLLAGLALAGLLAAPALADGMDNAVGNTVRVIIDESGNGFDAYFDADGSYSDSLERTGATWSWADGELCIVPPAEAEGASPNCGPWDGTLAVGGSMTTSDWSQDGSEITISILEGRGHDAPAPPPPPPGAAAE